MRRNRLTASVALFGTLGWLLANAWGTAEKPATHAIRGSVAVESADVDPASVASDTAAAEGDQCIQFGGPFQPLGARQRCR